MPMMLRRARLSDHRALVESAQRWWWEDPRTPAEGDPSRQLPRLFLQNFGSTSLVAEDNTGIKAFLVGFHSGDNDDDAYIHYVGVDPVLRGRGLARGLYSAFFKRAAEAGREQVRAVTSPRNGPSVAFHRALGFTPEAGDQEVDGLPVHSDYDGPGHHRVCFRRMTAG
ncbi:GNAT family N-acetyltransferase [Streptomyces sp. LP05-1]|uniref:GNAT family N-acetyltransferase n=1 Tax=Streptomyces pyxinae TaxID=2970734 RepID=A0ABT2CJT6_9ACTN|nr:GNAT family N-acetyltransferase [Streptomyces sp. LP05-1]MCS0636844.1 GNAT family N-acetyltransferase [Streptomyces sp. LP05-1]